MIIKLNGASDDCIEVDGDLDEEFYYKESNDRIEFSDGTIVGIEYIDAGLWKINIIQSGSGEATIEEASDPDSDNYSDVLTLHCIGDVSVTHKWDE